MTEISCKLLVIGGGPGGYVCAIKAGQLGVDTVIVEAAKLGGVCLNAGCIPSKALIHVADEFERMTHAAKGEAPFGLSAAAPVLDFKKTVAWKDGIVARLNTGVAGLLGKSRVRLIQGHARFRDGKTVVVDTNAGQQIVTSENIVIATGSSPLELSSLPFGGNVISSTEALSLVQVPAKLCVVGAGYIGLELGIAFAKLGSKVSIVEAQPHILPIYDKELTLPVAKQLSRLGVEVFTSTFAKAMAATGDALQVEIAGEVKTIPADKILVAVGRAPNVAGLGLDQLVLDMNGQFVQIGKRCETSMRGIFAVGDATGEPMLAHRAMAQGEMVAEIVAGHSRAWDHRCIPAVCFTDPEIVSVGLSPGDARRDGFDITIGQFPFVANGRAMTKNAESGLVRVVARRDNQLVLGIQAAGHGVSELAAGFALAIEMGARSQDIAGTIHAHPTMSEALQEAAFATYGKAIHM